MHESMMKRIGTAMGITVKDAMPNVIIVPMTVASVRYSDQYESFFIAVSTQRLSLRLICFLFFIV